MEMTTQSQGNVKGEEKMHSFECGGHTFTVAEKYELQEFLEIGPDGPECLVLNKNSNQLFRIKKLEHVFHNLYFARGIIREICLKRFLNHDNIFKIFDIMQPETVTYSHVYLVTDYLETTLHRVIFSQQSLSNAHIQFFMCQIIEAIFYLHSTGLIHRALCPEILHVNKQCDVKISDLAYVRPSQEGNDDRDSGLLPNRYYQSPEVLLDHQETQAMDIWAIGCILGELLGRNILFFGRDAKHQFQTIFSVIGTPEEDDLDFELPWKAKKFLQKLPKTNKTPWNNMFPQADPMALDLLENMLNVNPRKRFTALECLEHPYFKDLHDLNFESVCTEKFFWDYTNDDSEPTREPLQAILDEEIKKLTQLTLQNNNPF